MSEVNASEIVIESNTASAGSAVATPVKEIPTVEPTPVAKAGGVEAALTDTLNTLLRIKEKDENPDLLQVEAYVWENMGSRMIYFPYEMRSELNMIENVEGLIDPDGVYTDERDARFTPARRKVLQREYSVSGAVVYAYTDKILAHFEIERAPDANDFEEFNAMRRPIIALVQDNKAYFDEKLRAFREAGEGASVTTDELLAILSTPNLLIEYNDPLGAKIAMTTKKCTIVRTWQGTFIETIGNIHIYNGKLIQTQYKFRIPVFSGRKTFEELGVYDLSTRETERERLINRGKNYVKYTADASYLQNNGFLIRRSWYGTQQFNVKGRVIVDFNAMKMMDSEYEDYFGVDRYREVETEEVAIVTDEVYMTCAPFVYGFSLKVKKWGEMRMDDLEEITFRDDAFDRLVMDDVRKNMILALVKTRLEGKRDIIEGKGGGTIFMLEGSPGVGKTLTAETVAEVLHRPLHMVSIGELGTSADQLEERLRKILDIATVWNAVLLIDEADVFMEERKADDIERNAMVGVFLRLLEYYEGILFLTTNRANNIDGAFYSRISMAIHYEPLDSEARYTIWENLLDMAGITTISAYEISDLSDYELNGRQIKNIINNARSLAQHAERDVDVDDLEMVIEVGQDFQDSMIESKAVAKRIDIQTVNFEDEYGYGYRDTLLSRFFRGVGSFFNMLGGGR
jgi:hypothetical protein